MPMSALPGSGRLRSVRQRCFGPLVQALPGCLRGQQAGAVHLRRDAQHQPPAGGALRRAACLLAGEQIVIDRFFKRSLQACHSVSVKAHAVINAQQVAHENVIAGIEFDAGAVACGTRRPSCAPGPMYPART